MAEEKVKANVSGGAGGSRYAPRAIVKRAAKLIRRREDKSAERAVV